MKNPDRPQQMMRSSHPPAKGGNTSMRTPGIRSASRRAERSFTKKLDTSRMRPSSVFSRLRTPYQLTQRRRRAIRRKLAHVAARRLSRTTKKVHRRRQRLRVRLIKRAQNNRQAQRIDWINLHLPARDPRRSALKDPLDDASTQLKRQIIRRSRLREWARRQNDCHRIRLVRHRRETHRVHEQAHLAQMTCNIKRFATRPAARHVAMIGHRHRLQRSVRPTRADLTHRRSRIGHIRAQPRQ